jgi:formylglycine-generating enzyme required for sulfatase activity
VDGVGVAATPDPTCSGRTLTGTGGNAWNHHLQEGGISDLVGNVWEMVDGLQLVNGVLWVNDDNNNLINTGIAPTFGTSGGSFSLLRADESLKTECIPATGTGIVCNGGDGFYFATSGTMVLYRGGNWANGSLCGLFAFSVNSPASSSSTDVGFRLARPLI